MKEVSEGTVFGHIGIPECWFSKVPSQNPVMAHSHASSHVTVGAFMLSRVLHLEPKQKLMISLVFAR